MNNVASKVAFNDGASPTALQMRIKYLLVVCLFCSFLCAQTWRPSYWINKIVDQALVLINRLSVVCISH